MLVTTTPSRIRLWRRQAVGQPDDDVIVNNPPFLEFGHPGVTGCFVAGAAVVPLAQGVKEPANVLWPPIAVIALVGQGLHPNLLPYRPLVMELLRSDSKALSKPGNPCLVTVNLNTVFCTENRDRKTFASC